MLVDALSREPGDKPRDPSALASDNAHAAARWIGATPTERAAALVDLLELADAMPFCARSEEIGLPEKVLAVDGALAEAGIAHAIGGALALAYYAEPRATVDIDVNVFVRPQEWPVVRDALSPLGIDVIVDASALADAGEVKLDWGPNPVHLFFSQDELHEEMPRAVRKVPLGEATIPIVAPEHLVVRKAILDRPKDWLDIEQILVATDPLDLAEIEAWLEEMVGEANPRLTRLREIVERLGIDDRG